MPRRRKPPGYGRWTWAEINAGRRMSKSEKRWNRMARDLNWDQRSDGTYQAPAQAVPLLVISLVLMFALAVLAPNGVHNTKGDAGAAATIVFLLLAVAMLLLPLIGHNRPSSSESEPAPSPAPTPVPARPPALPVVGPFLKKALGGAAGILSLPWMDRLPEWAQPIAWPLVLMSPLVGVAVRWRHGGSLPGDLALCLVFMMTIAVFVRLIRASMAVRRSRREQEDAERKADRKRFQAALVRELRIRPTREFDFAALVAREAVARFDADCAAAEVYRRFSDKAVEDGVITAAERRGMDQVARMLEIGPDRVAVIEASAKSGRYREAVTDVLADGVVTEDEARSLEALRASLEVSESDRLEGEIKIRAAGAVFKTGD